MNPKKRSFLKIVLPITILLLLFFVGPNNVSAQTEDLYIYEIEIIEQAGEKKESIKKFDINSLASDQTKDKKSKALNPFYIETLFKKDTVVLDLKEKLIDTGRSFTGSNLYPTFPKPIEEYISQIYERYKKPEYTTPLEKILSYSEPIIEPHAHLTSGILDNLFKVKASPTSPITNLLNYKREEVPINKSIVAEKFAERISTGTPTEPDTNENKLLNFNKELPEENQVMDITPERTPSHTEREELLVNRDTSSKTITLTLTILPVRFVYINNQNEITRIWSNVREDHSIYVLKFYKDDEKTEIKADRSLEENYFKIIKDIDLFKEGVIYPKSTEGLSVNYAYQYNNYDLQVDFEETPFGVEEIYTLI